MQDTNNKKTEENERKRRNKEGKRRERQKQTEKEKEREGEREKKKIRSRIYSPHCSRVLSLLCIETPWGGRTTSPPSWQTSSIAGPQTSSSPWHDHKDAGRTVTIPLPPRIRSWHRSSDASRSSPAIRSPTCPCSSFSSPAWLHPPQCSAPQKASGAQPHQYALWQTWDNHSCSSSVSTVCTSTRSIHRWPRPQATWWWDHWDLSRKDIRQNEEGP